MEFKFIGFLLIIILEYGSCLDVNNCTNTSLSEPTFAPNPTMKFYLFTRRNFFIEQEIFTGDRSSLINSNFNPNNPIRIIVHGWTSYLMSCINGEIKDAYLQKGDFNVFVVDWGDWSQNKNYFNIVPYIFKILGPLLAKFINFLNQNGNIPYNNIYLIGHSLGAHMSGSAGQNIRPNKVNTIFGLDPAGPGFHTASPDQRLDENDAKYVEQISTNMGGAGYDGILGHGAFYPNYGRIQPYCIKYELGIIGCSHGTSFLYFAESINTPIGFCGQPCRFFYIDFGFGCSALQCPGGQKILMGGEPSIPKLGTFLVRTNSNRDFAACNC